MLKYGGQSKKKGSHINICSVGEAAKFVSVLCVFYSNTRTVMSRKLLHLWGFQDFEKI